MSPFLSLSPFLFLISLPYILYICVGNAYEMSDTTLTNARVQIRHVKLNKNVSLASNLQLPYRGNERNPSGFVASEGSRVLLTFAKLSSITIRPISPIEQ